MKKIFLLSFMSVLLLNSLFSQVLKGIVKDGDTGDPVPYIKLEYSDDINDAYTVTNEKGEFTFENFSIEYYDYASLTLERYDPDWENGYYQDFEVNPNDSTFFNLIIYSESSEYWDTVTYINDIAADNPADFGFSFNGYSPVIDETDDAFKFSPSFDVFIEGQAKIAKNFQLGVKLTYIKMAWINLNNDTLITKLYHEKERYFSATTELFVFTRFVTKTGDSRGFFADLGVGYSLPYTFRYTYYTDKYIKTSTRNIHKFNDFQAMFRLGFYAFDIKATYRLTDIIKDNDNFNLIEPPKLTIGIEFNIPLY